MAKLALAMLLLLAVAAATASASIDIDMDLGFLSTASSGGRRECRGTVAECMAEEDEDAELGGAAEPHGRVLAGRRRGYISYGALRRDNVPCSRRGASYYNCRPGAQANPYSRGCSRITRCRG